MNVSRTVRNIRLSCICLAAASSFCLFWNYVSVVIMNKRRHADIFTWNKQTRFCGDNYIGYEHLFFKLRKTIYNPVNDVFMIYCQDARRPTHYDFKLNHYSPTRYTRSLQYSNNEIVATSDYKIETEMTFIMEREFPHNFFHTMTLWYNIYTVSKILDFFWLDVNILLLDNGPVVQLDPHWERLFPRIIKASRLKTPLYMNEAIFNIEEHNSLLYKESLDSLPFIDEFTGDFLAKFNLTNNKKLDCSNLTVILVMRRDYFFHPELDTVNKRNTQRKFKNEEEILKTLKLVFDGHTIRTMISEEMSLQEQLELAVQTDVFIAMHGCSLTHILFLPGHSTILEMYPAFWEIKSFFRAFAKWRGLKFDVWQNKDKRNEFPDHYTRIPPEVLTEYGSKAKQHLQSACDISVKVDKP